VELRKATDEEIVIARKQAKEEHEVQMQNKIDELEEELNKLKRE
jgi:hypothetical protein